MYIGTSMSDSQTLDIRSRLNGFAMESPTSDETDSDLEWHSAGRNNTIDGAQTNSGKTKKFGLTVKNRIREWSGDKNMNSHGKWRAPWMQLTSNRCHNATRNGLNDHHLGSWNGLNWRPDEPDCRMRCPTDWQTCCPIPGEWRFENYNRKNQCRKSNLWSVQRNAQKRRPQKRATDKDWNRSSAEPCKRRVRHSAAGENSRRKHWKQRALRDKTHTHMRGMENNLRERRQAHQRGWKIMRKRRQMSIVLILC